METTGGFDVKTVMARKGERLEGIYLGTFATIADAFAGLGKAIEADESKQAEHFLFVIEEQDGSRTWTITIGW